MTLPMVRDELFIRSPSLRDAMRRCSTIYRMDEQHPQRINLGIIGASKFADFCLQHYAGIETLRPTGVWSRTPASAEDLAKSFNLQAVDSIDALLQQDVQLIHVATLPSQHADQVRAALSAGKHVLVEKPMATTLHDATAMAAQASAAGLTLGVNFMMRHGRLANVVEQIIRQNVLGKCLRGYVVNCAGDGGLPKDHWFWNRYLSGGIFIEHGVHFFDLLRSWLGEGTVTCAMQLARPGTDLIDQVFCDVRYGEETTVNYYHGFTQSHHTDGQTIRLIFEQGELTVAGWVADRLELQAVLSDSAADQLRSLLPGDAVFDQRKLPADARQSSRRTGQRDVDVFIEASWRTREDKQTTYGQALEALMRDLLRAIQTGTAPAVSAGDGVAAVAIAEAAQTIADETTTQQLIADQLTPKE